MAYISLYRKYRSQSFGELIGQEHVTTVLQNALRQGRIAHAYLFCGPRGCGKTSTARLLARALNCQGRDGNASGPTPDPCGVCDLCVRIREGSAMDVIEMDAASETGIDDVREKIIENAKYAPGEARFKVYIIDEVHDLSLKAFDSLLKTIEEPPAHVVFMLATTEVHKVPITIRSRCQRMDFRRGGLGDLAGNIERVLSAENICFETEAVAAVARAAEGSFRDSLSLLEQALAFTDGDFLTSEAVHASIGTVGPQLLDEMTRIIASDDNYAAFVKAGQLVQSGKDVKQTLIALQGHLRDLMVAGIANSAEALSDVSPERFEQLREQSSWFSMPQFLKMLDVLADTERNLRFTNQHQRLLEVAFWNILPRQLTGRAAIQGAMPASSLQPAPQAAQPSNLPAPTAVRPQTVRSASPAPIVPVDATPENYIESMEDPGSFRQPSSEPSPPAPQIVPVRTAPSSPAAASSDSPFAGRIDLDGIRRVWPRVVRKILQKSRAAGAYFGNETVLALDGHIVLIGFPNEFMKIGADKPKGRELMEMFLGEELGMAGLKVRCILEDGSDRAPAPVPSGELQAPIPLNFVHESSPDPSAYNRAPLPETVPESGYPEASLPHASSPQPQPHTNGHHPPPHPSTNEESASQKARLKAQEEAAYFNLVMEEFDGTLLSEDE